MKLFKILLLALCVQSQLSAQAPLTKAQVTLLKQYQALPLEKQTAYKKLKKKALENYDKGKFFTCLVVIDQAQQISLVKIWV